MATVHIGYHFADGDEFDITVEADESYPDSLDQARSVAVRGFAEALGISLEINQAEDDG